MSLEKLQNPIAGSIVSFLVEIGLKVSHGSIMENTFLPGIMLDHGVLIFDEAKLMYPGDLLHEAGHLAVMRPGRRSQVHLDVGKKAAEEMMAIAWSYAAALHLKLEPAVVFHAGGYRGGAQALIDNFTQGRYIGVPMLQWLGMTVDEKRAKDEDVAPYPHMLRWLRHE